MRKARPEISGLAFLGLLFQKRILMAHWKSGQKTFFSAPSRRSNGESRTVLAQCPAEAVCVPSQILEPVPGRERPQSPDRL